jgi:hypothetical protein
MIHDLKILSKAIVATLVAVFVALLIIGLIVFAFQAVFEPSLENKAAMRVPQLLSEADGCRVYRFIDGGTHYFTRCGSHVETVKNYTESCGKACTRNRTEKLTTEDNK